MGFTWCLHNLTIKQGEIMKLSLLLTTVLSGLLLSGCGAAEDAVNDAVKDTVLPADTSSASYTASSNNSGGFDITFNVDNSGTSVYSYKIGSSLETTTHRIDDVDYSITDVVGSQYSDLSGSMSENDTNTLSCTPTNEETFACTDDIHYTTFSVDLKPKIVENGLETLYLYKCKTSVDYSLTSNSKVDATCEKQAASITVNGLHQ